ncbi:MAG: ferredoxin [Sulfurihydrogenibium sp.]|jgi:ferredoxin|uniref:ferredoxin n=1 Tax=Sulfurihydrogenibium sp. TaxID=2053621 RepID=UPI000CB33384|nr:MAG: ferredoxin [Sulfurihydrogenibium sp.]
MGKLKVVVDRNLCEGIGVCVPEAPKYIVLDKRHKAVILEPGKDKEQLFQEVLEKKRQEVVLELTIEEEEDIFRAAEACPVKAIFVYDPETGEQLYP